MIDSNTVPFALRQLGVPADIDASHKRAVKHLAEVDVWLADERGALERERAVAETARATYRQYGAPPSARTAATLKYCRGHGAMLDEIAARQAQLKDALL